MRHPILKTALLSILIITCRQAKAQIVDTIINTGNYQLHFKITKGSGTGILFESGGGLNAMQWDSIMIALHQQIKATLITYDRQGFGKSSMDTAHYNLVNEIKGLEFGLKKLGYGGSPVILVSHSLGAFYARLYCSRHPKQVKGMIMFDPRIPSLTDMAFARKTFKTIDRKNVKSEDMSLYYVLAAMENNSNYLRRIPVPPSIPILDIMAEIGPYDSVEDNNRFKADQLRFVKASTKRSLLFAKGSSHNIPQDKPQFAINEIVSFYKKHL